MMHRYVFNEVTNNFFDVELAQSPRPEEVTDDKMSKETTNAEHKEGPGSSMEPSTTGADEHKEDK